MIFPVFTSYSPASVTTTLSSYLTSLRKSVELDLDFVCLFVWLVVFNNLISLAVLGLHCCADFSLVVVGGGYALAVVHRLLIAVASLVAKHRL